MPCKVVERKEVGVEIPERSWIEAGLFWIVLALLCAIPRISASVLGEIARTLVCIVAIVHLMETFYAMSIARAANLDPVRWALRTLVLGVLSLRRLRELAASGPHPL